MGKKGTAEPTREVRTNLLCCSYDARVRWMMRQWALAAAAVTSTRAACKCLPYNRHRHSMHAPCHAWSSLLLPFILPLDPSSIFFFFFVFFVSLFHSFSIHLLFILSVLSYTDRATRAAVVIRLMPTSPFSAQRRRPPSSALIQAQHRRASAGAWQANAPRGPSYGCVVCKSERTAPS